MPPPETTRVPQVPKSCQALGAGESAALLGGSVSRRWRPPCWADAGHWVSPVLVTVTPPS